MKKMTLDEIREVVDTLDIGFNRKYLVKFVDGFWFEHETTVTADCDFDAIDKVQEQFKNASNFSVSEIK